MSEEQNNRSWTEAPSSATVKAKYGGREWMITMRAERVGELIKQIDAINEWLDRHAEAVNVEPTPPEVKATHPAPAPAAPGTAAPQTGGGTFHVVKMTTTPRADGKIDLAFFEPNHQYADIKAAKTTAEAVALLKMTGAWNPQHFTAVAEYAVNFLVDWQPSANLNKNGKPYKNIVAVKPAQA